MAHVTLGRWGKSLAVRIPLDLAQAAGWSDGERLDVRAEGDSIVIHRPAARAQTEAQRAAEEIIAESEHYALVDQSVREMLEDGRRE